MVVTDNNSLYSLCKLKDSCNRIARWIIKLQEYDYSIKYNSSNINLLPDCLSFYVQPLLRGDSDCDNEALIFTLELEM